MRACIAGEEQISWQKLSEDLNEALTQVVGDVMVASACISYYGPLSFDYRERLVQHWLESCTELGLRVSDKFSVRATLASDVTVRDWNIHGLPSNHLSVDNGVIVTNCQRWPLLIDPQLQVSICAPLCTLRPARAWSIRHCAKRRRREPVQK